MAHRAPRVLTAALALLTIAQSTALALDCAQGTNCGSGDTVIGGCSVGAPGEVGIETLIGSFDEIKPIAILVSAMQRIDAFTIDLLFPDHLVEYHSLTVAGTLTESFQFVGDGPFPGGVRIGGFGGVAFIPEGSEGNLVIVNFRITATGGGCGDFCFLNLLDDLSGYAGCAYDATSAEESVPSASWGIVKALYR